MRLQEMDVEGEEKSLHRTIREAVKRNDIVSARALAREIVSSRKAVKRLQNNKAQLSSLSMHVGESIVMMLHLYNILHFFFIDEGMIEEMVNDAVDTALDTEDIEKETEEEVNKVLAEIAGETGSQHPESVRKVKIELPTQGACPASEAHKKTIAEGADEEEELEQLRVTTVKGVAPCS
ncbi:hypothetical protein L1049_011209 [Liquidambar formosana]|uniref:Charged multivesicular body protein 3 n=1 Tax=Liquidambar formosana TaxID=63359 RepID=A0AAP0WXY6_LIQFO